MKKAGSDAQEPVSKMKSSDNNRHSFIVRIWREPRELEGAVPKWRGEIEHAASGVRRGLKELHDITAFIAGYLRNMGVWPTALQRLRKWLKNILDFRINR